MINREELFASQLPLYSGDIRFPDSIKDKCIVILDEDPTGCQTLHDVPVLFQWDTRLLSELFNEEVPVFFIILNTRNLSPERAKERINEVMNSLKEARDYTGRHFVVISRSDSSLRGHYPLEPELINESMDYRNSVFCLIPASFQEGRFTCNDVHYIQAGDLMLPVTETQIARDSSFGFTSSNLAEYVIEKYEGKVAPENILSFSLAEIRQKGPDHITDRLLHTTSKVCIVNALDQKDLDVFAAGAWGAICRGRNLVFRSAASFINSFARIGINPPLDRSFFSLDSKAGGLIVVGPHEHKSGSQLSLLIAGSDIFPLEMDVEMLLSERKNTLLVDVVKSIQDMLQRGKNVVVFSSWEAGNTYSVAGNRDPVQEISNALVKVVGKLNVNPSFVINRCSLISYDIAAESMQMKRTKILGQVLPGVPVLESDNHPHVKYIIFPEDMGEEADLLEVYEKITKKF